MFYTYSQNNSGGFFDDDENCGIGPYVIIEADSAEHADDRACDIGLYFGGVEYGKDCDCCGDRWYRGGDWGTGYEQPTLYGKVVGAEIEPDYISFYGYMPCYVHYIDGTFRPFNSDTMGWTDD